MVGWGVYLIIYEVEGVFRRTDVMGNAISILRNVHMKNCKYLITLCIIIITLVSCKKQDSESQVKTVPVEWLLSAQDKNLFQAFSNNMVVQYSDANNNILNFQTDGISSITTCPENSFDKGESLIVNYNT